MGSKEEITQVIVSDKVIEEKKNRVLSTGDGQIGLSISHMIQSRFRVLYIETHEEKRTIDFFKDLSVYRGYELFQWDCDRGLLLSNTKEKIGTNNTEIHDNPAALLAFICDRANEDSSLINKNKSVQDKIYLLLDFHTFLDIPQVQRKVKEFSEINSGCTVVIVSPVFACPTVLEKYVTVIDFPSPSKSEIENILYPIVNEVSVKLPNIAKQYNEHKESLIKSVAGLTLTEAENAFAMSIVKEKKFDMPTILNEKKQTIRKNGILEYRTPRFKMSDVGGLQYLKEWLKLRKSAFTDDAREFGIPCPKGILLCGIPGTGKSMACDAVSCLYEIPHLRLDFGSIFTSHVGDSEKNIRQCLKVAEALSPVLVQIDEIEKGISGVDSSSYTDGGVTSRVFGTLLTWMQDRTSPVFLICTANNVSGIPPEFMRAGRFDEVFFIDLPGLEERKEIIEALLRRKKRNPENIDVSKIASKCDSYTAAEIEKGIDNALFIAYADKKRNLTENDIIFCLKQFPPLSSSRREEIAQMREWALGKNGSGGRAVLANPAVQNNNSNTVNSRKIDLGDSNDLSEIEI